MEEGFAIWANPSSPHAEGRGAKAALEDARERIKRSLGWDGELIFTSGASEALAIGLQRTKADRRIVSAVEHDAVFRAAPDAEVVPVHNFEKDIRSGPVGVRGCLDLDRMPDCSGAIVAVQHVNSETGVKQPVSDIAKTVRAAGGLLLSDCSQSAGKLGLPDADMIVVSAHKFGGPIGIGALLVKNYAMLEPMGGHERGYRQGTENMPGALGMAAALECDNWVGLRDGTSDWPYADEILDPEDLLGWCTKARYIYAIDHPTMSAQALLIRLDAMGFAVSAGSACSSGTLKKSRVLDAFGVSDDEAARTIRVSLGWNTTLQEVEQFADAWDSLQ